MTDTTEFEAMEKSGWGNPNTAKSYADGFAVATKVVAAGLAENVDAQEKLKVLDLCSGHGVVSAALVERGAQVTGLDFSEAMIELAQASAPKARFVLGDAMNVQFPDQSFDAVTIGFGVPHFPSHERGLAEAARVLKSGGRLAFSIWHGPGSNGAFGWLFDAFARLGDPAITLPPGPDAHSLVARNIAEPIVRAAGFENISVENLPTQLSVSTPEALFDAFDLGAVRAAALLQQQPDEIRQAIRQDLANRVLAEGTKMEDGYVVPAPAAIVSAVRS